MERRARRLRRAQRAPLPPPGDPSPCKGQRPPRTLPGWDARPGGGGGARDPAGGVAPPRRDARGPSHPDREGAVAPPPPFPGPRLSGCPVQCLTRGLPALPRPLPVGRSETAQPGGITVPSAPRGHSGAGGRGRGGGAAQDRRSRTARAASGGVLAGGGQACGGAQRCLLHFALQPRWLQRNLQIAERPRRSGAAAATPLGTPAGTTLSGLPLNPGSRPGRQPERTRGSPAPLRWPHGPPAPCSSVRGPPWAL